MSKKNDERILQLKNVVVQKKELINELKSEGVGYKTHLVLNFDDKNYNLNVLKTEDLNLLLVKLSLYKKEAFRLEVKLKVNDYSIEDWITDIKTKIRVHHIRDKERSLKIVEKTLDEKLSLETKNKIDIDNIEADLLNL